jgi:YggT family protein
MGIFVTVPEGHSIIYGIILYGIGVLLLALIIRALASWVRIDERFAFIRFLAKFTDPFIAPYRRIIPPMGFLDVSFILGFFTLITLQILLTQALPVGW